MMCGSSSASGGGGGGGGGVGGVCVCACVSVNGIVIPLRWYHLFTTLEVVFRTIASRTLRYQHGSPKHLSHMNHLTAFFDTRARSILPPSRASLSL